MSSGVTHVRASTFLYYGLALGFVAAAEALKICLSWEWAAPHWLITFLPAITASAWVGGCAPGLVSTAASALVVMYLELPPKHSLRVEDAAELIGVVVLVGIGLVVSVLARKERRWRDPRGRGGGVPDAPRWR
jgi:K+-sensing histidine kinase KdpD